MMTGDVIRLYARRLIPVALAGVLALVAIGLLIASLLLALLEVMPPSLATLLTALMTSLAAGVLLLAHRSRRRRRRRQPPPSVLDELMPALQLAVGRNPLATAAAATLLGAVTEILMKSSGSRKP
jgi:hypothetical protein